MNEQYYKEVGQRLFALRKQLGITRAELGKKINLHEVTVKRYEDGDVKKLDISKIKAFAIALETTSTYIMGWEQVGTHNEDVTNARLFKKICNLPERKKLVLESLVDLLLESDN